MGFGTGDNLGLPGNTNNATLTDNWQKVSNITGTITVDDNQASGILLSFATYGIAYAYSDLTAPYTVGHALSAGDYLIQTKAQYDRLWIKNGAAGSNAVMAWTPFF